MLHRKLIPLLRTDSPRRGVAPSALAGVLYQQMSEPVRTSPLPIEGMTARHTEPIIVVAAPSMDSWYVPASEPILMPSPLRSSQWWSGVLEPSLFIIPDMDSWFRQITEPVRKPPLPTEGNNVFDVEPITGVVVPPLDSWFRQTVEPVRTPSPLRFSEWWVGITEPSLFIIPDFDSWWQPTSEPVRVHPRAAELGQLFTTPGVVATGGPFTIDAQDSYNAGSVASDFYNAGAIASDFYNAGAIASEESC